MMVVLQGQVEICFSEACGTYRREGSEFYNKIKVYKSPELCIIDKPNDWMCRVADKRTQRKMPRVLITGISQTLYSLQSTFPFIMSCHLHNNPVNYKLSHFPSEDKALIEELAPTSRVPKRSVCRLRARLWPPALTFCAMPHCHSGLRPPKSQPDCFS